MKNSATILVTGGAGFIGSRLTRRLQSSGYRVRVLDTLTAQIHGAVPQGCEWLAESGVEFIRGSVTTRTDWERAVEGIEAVVHLAAETGTGQSMYEIARYNEVNSQGTALLFDVLAQQRSRSVKRVILASSRSVYGEGRYACSHCALDPIYPNVRSVARMQDHQWEPECPRCRQSLTAMPTREIDAIKPASIYAATKYAQEDMVRIACESLKIGYAIFRLQNVFGEGQSLKNPYTGILSIFSTKIRQGAEVPLFEDGEESRDFVHVDDVVQAISLGLQSERAINDVMNIGSGEPTTVREASVELAKALGREVRVTVTGQFRVGDIRHNFADITRAADRLGFAPRVTFSEGVARFAAWVNGQPLFEDRGEQANLELRSRNLMGN